MAKIDVPPKEAPPLFMDGERVFHQLKNTVGVVRGYIGGEQRRYYVEHSRFIWSVPEKYLDSPPKSSR